MKDRYLKYFVVRVPKKARNISKTTQETRKEVIDGEEFKNFLDAKKQKIMESQSHLANIHVTSQSLEERNKNYTQSNEHLK